MALLNGYDTTVLRLGRADVKAGRPLPWNVYDEDGVLLYAEGIIIHSFKTMEELLERGIYRRLRNIAPDQEKLKKEEEEERKREEARRREDNRPLDQIPIHIGDVVQLQPLAGNEDERLTARLVGFVPGKSVIVTTPVKDKRLVALKEGQTFVIRLFSGSSVYAFSSHVIRQANIHCSYLHFTYPNTVRGQILRHGVRANVGVIASITNQAGFSNAARIQDLSIGGARLVGKAVLGDKNSEVMIKFRVKFDQYDEYLHIKGIIRSVNISEDESEVSHGVQFLDMPAEYKFVLTAFVYQFLLAGQE